MRSMRVACFGLAVAAALVFVAQSAVGGPPKKKSNRWLVTASVANGSQVLTRISNSSTPQHHGAGDVDSHWRAQWRIAVRIVGGRQVVIPGVKAFSVTGSASGEYRGYYPKTGGVEGSYTCPFGPLAPKSLLTKLRLIGQGEAQGAVHVGIGVDGEPGVLPPLTCTGDLPEADVARTLSAGVLTGIESACFRDPVVKGAQLNARKAFTFTKKIGWDPPSPTGIARPCNGFGSPIWSAGYGTLRLRFVPIG